VSGARKHWVKALGIVGPVVGAELDFEEVVLDRSCIACEHDVGDIAGGGDDVVTGQGGHQSVRS